MYIWSNDGYTDNCIHYIGNGRMLIESSGPNIRTILGSRYTSLPFLSAVIDENTQRLTSLTQFENGIWQHKLTYSDNPANSFTGSAYFIYFTDHMDRKYNLFVRRFHAINPLSFKLIIPRYVKVCYDQSYRLSGNTYAAAVIFTIQETTVPHLLNYCKLFLIMNGNTEFDQENNRIYCKSGDGSIIIAVGEEEKDIQDASFILNRYNQSLNHTVLFYSKYINRFHGRSHEDKYVVRALKLLESVSVFYCICRA